MSVRFYLIAALMLAAALVCALLPMLRSARRNGQPRSIFVLALLLAFALPPAAIALYAWYGAPQALAPTPDAQLDMVAATAQLRAKLQQSPDHVDGWLLLAQAYSAMNRPADARDAFGRAMKLKPDDPDIIVAYVEAEARARQDHHIDKKSRDLLGHVVSVLDNTNQRAYWLLGIGDYQAGEFESATLDWWRLLEMLPENSTLATAVRTQIAMAQARHRGLSQAQADAEMQLFAQWQEQIAQGKTKLALPLLIELDAKFSTRVSSNDPVSVEVSPTNDPQRELLNLHFKASQLPLSIALTDAMAASKFYNLSMFPRLNVQAGVLISGSPPPGYGLALIGYGSVDTNSTTPLVLKLNQLVPSGPLHGGPVRIGPPPVQILKNNISAIHGRVMLLVQVKVDPKLAGKVSPGDTLFVFARAIDGPPMPLAVARLHASQLPATVTLTDAMAMAPQWKLSMFPHVQVFARISRNGNALPQTGDLEADAKPVESDSQGSVELTIDHAH